jgi:hypothetical protein
MVGGGEDSVFWTKLLVPPVFPGLAGRAAKAGKTPKLKDLVEP